MNATGLKPNQESSFRSHDRDVKEDKRAHAVNAKPVSNLTEGDFGELLAKLLRPFLLLVAHGNSHLRSLDLSTSYGQDFTQSNEEESRVKNFTPKLALTSRQVTSVCPE